MRTMNTLFAVAFAAVGVCALLGALICGAAWHFGTAAMCFALVVVLHLENKSIKDYRR